MHVLVVSNRSDIYTVLIQVKTLVFVSQLKSAPICEKQDIKGFQKSDIDQ